MASRPSPQLACWLLDVRSLWPGDRISDTATDALALLTDDERAKVLGRHFIQDARMILGSALLKRLFVARYLDPPPTLPWSNLVFARRGDPVHGKPSVPPELTRRIGKRVDFNISHQAGLVALIGVVEEVGDGQGRGVEVGVDITCVNERHDDRTIDREGFDAWVETFGEFFSADECWDMTYTVGPAGVALADGSVVATEALESSTGRPDRCVRNGQTFMVRRTDGSSVPVRSDEIVEAKLRRFYAFYCYKEAYIKMSGEAMMADWLQQLEFRNVKSPAPRRGVDASEWGESVVDAEAYRDGVEQTEVALELRAWEEKYMIGIAVRPGEGLRGKVPPFEPIDLENDIMAAAKR